MTWNFPYKFEVLNKRYSWVFQMWLTSGRGLDSLSGYCEDSSWPVWVWGRGLSEWLRPPRRKSFCSLHGGKSLCLLWFPLQCLLLTPNFSNLALHPRLAFSGVRLCRPSGYSASGLHIPGGGWVKSSWVGDRKLSELLNSSSLFGCKWQKTTSNQLKSKTKCAREREGVLPL